MEIDVTHMVEDSNTMPMLSGSIAELGQGAAKFTWCNSQAYGREHPLLTTDDQRDEARAWLKDFGAWSAEEIAAWSDDELNALIVQFIAGDIREMDAYEDADAFEAAGQEGHCSGRLGRGDDGRWWFYIGN